MSVGPILTQGLGVFGSVNKLPTLGFTPAQIITNLIRLSVSAKLLDRLTVAGKKLDQMTVTGVQKTAITLSGVFRDV